MAAVVVGEVLLRGGEAGSVVPTKVPGNLERRVSQQPVLTVRAPCTLQDRPDTGPFYTQGGPTLNNLHGTLGAGSTREKTK